MSLLHDNLNNAAETAPEQDAFRCGQQSLTYSELHRDAGRLAALLTDLGVEQGDCVAICMPPCVESATAVYGIMKAGAAFVPIDPHAPDHRRQHLLSAGRIRHLITAGLADHTLHSLESHVSSLQTIIGAGSLSGRLNCIPWSQVQQWEEGSDAAVGDDSPAYVIFTSGSTGTPKGILHSHESGHSYARLSVNTYGVTQHDRIANLSPLHFDMATFAYLSSPLAAATAVLIPAAFGKLPASLSQLIEQQRITIWYSVPFALIQLLERGVLDQRDLSTLRWVMFGGEPFSPSHLNALRRLWPHVSFSNVYGPAEVNQCTFYHIPPFSAGAEPRCDDSQSMPIGRVWEETLALVVDEHDEEVADEECGELLVHSSTMMTRYWNGTGCDPDTFFVPDDAQVRYYRTGDLVRHNGQGDLIFIGRKDRQVKVRGYRIELDEVEHAVAQHEAVEEAAVFCVRKHAASTIIAAVTLVGDAQVAAAELQAYLTKVLPVYAVPELIHIRDSLPRTTSGKIDRRAVQQQIYGADPESSDPSAVTGSFVA